MGFKKLSKIFGNSDWIYSNLPSNPFPSFHICTHGGWGSKAFILIKTKNLFRLKLTFKLFLVWLPECRRRRSILVLLPNLVQELLLSLQLLLLPSQLLLLSFYLLPLLLNPTQDKYYSLNQNIHKYYKDIRLKGLNA